MARTSQGMREVKAKASDSEDHGQTPTNSPGSDEIAEIMTALKSRMSKKASAQQKKNETHCKELCERIQRDGEALLDRHSKAAASVLESHRRQSEDLEEHEARILRQFAEEADRYAADQESLRKAYEEGVLARKALDQELSNWMDDMVELAFRQTDETANLCPPEAPSLAIGNVPKKRKMVGRLQ